MKKITYAELCEAMFKFNKENPEEKFNRKLTGVVVFTENSFNAPYTEKERSYRVDNSQKAFRPDAISNSIWSDCLDGKDLGVRIDLYMQDGWKVDYCYLEEKEA